MATSVNLRIDYLAPAQSQKHVTVNEALTEIDCVLQCAVIQMMRNAPPSDPNEGDRYHIGGAPEGVWSRSPGRIALFFNTGWWYYIPEPGWRMYNLADDTLYVMSTTRDWVPISGPAAVPSEFQSLTRFGLGATATTANPFVAKLNSALWTARTLAEGGTGDLFLTANRSNSQDNVGHLFQTAFVTRAMMGLFESDRFRISVSPDGAVFHDALLVDDRTGIADLPCLPRFKAYTDYDNYGALDIWNRIGINIADSNDQGAFNAATNCFVAPATGSYVLGASLLHKVKTSATARPRARLVLNGTTPIRGAFAELTGPAVSLASTLSIQTLAVLSQGDRVELQGSYAVADGWFAAEQTCFWGYKVG